MTQDNALKILQDGHHAFLTGPAGSGKTYVFNKFINWAHTEKLKVAITASTGIAATHLGGSTIHSWSGIGIKDELSAYEIDGLAQREYLYKRFGNTDILIIDEVSMLDEKRVNLIDEVLRAVSGINEPYGGIQVVFAGDFFQLPPISRGGNTVQFAFQADAWNEMDLEVCYLDKVHRQSDDPLLDILTEIRSGTVSQKSLNALESRVDLADDDNEHTKIYTHNIDVNALNDAELAKISEKPHSYYMQTSGKKNQIVTLKKYCLAPEELELKIGARVMFLKNNPAAGYINGTLGTVTECNSEYPTVETDSGKEIIVKPELWVMEQGNVIQAELTQLPLRLAWAITVHKSQGMTLDSAQIDLSKSFAPGMGYVALSRVTSLDGLFIKGINKRALSISDTVREFDQALPR